MEAVERFLRYVQINTRSDEESDSTPSSDNVFALAEILKNELLELGASDVALDRSGGVVYAKIPATEGYESKKKIGFVAHMDTSPDFSGENVSPLIHENYDGGDVTLGDSGRVLRVSDFPHLADLRGRTLITTDGTTLLGADDKAGVAAIMTMVERVIAEKIPHGQISIAFTPDEEVGRGTESFDLEKFDAELAYTVDGDDEGEIVYENFNAASADIIASGFNVHPGSAKDTMVNAALVLVELNSMLPSADTPRNTEGYEGFYHLTSISGDVEHAESHYIIRDHSKECFEARKRTIAHAVNILNQKYGSGTLSLKLTDSYGNMRDKIEPYMEVVDRAKEAIRSIGLEPKSPPIRGGTDGARLSALGLPCPNLGTGGHAFHGPYEHITVEGLELAADIIVGIVKAFAEHGENNG